MNQPKYKGKELLPLSVIDAARDGDAQAVDSVLRYYEGYINKLSTRTVSYTHLDVYKRQKENRGCSNTLRFFIWFINF